jgi:hypothetical protein
MAIIFMSHSAKDKEFVRKLSFSLQELNYKVWLDEWEVRVGDSIVTKVEGGIERANFVAVVLSKHSTISKWVETEWQSKYWDEVNKRQVMVLPILIEDCEIPVLLRQKKYADFRSSYPAGLRELVAGLQSRSDVSGIAHYTHDFVDEKENWRYLFTHSTRLDLLVMYASTWRNTYLKYIRALLKRGGQLRVVLPTPGTKSNPAIGMYSKRLSIPVKELRLRINEAICEFSELSSHGHVEIYTTTKYLNHACYLFDTGGVVAFYSYQTDRVPTPALILREGKFLDFLQTDFDWLVSDQNPTRSIILAPPLR